MDEINFWEPDFWGFGLEPFGIVDIWWVETQRNSFAVYAFPHYHWFAGKLFPAGCAQDCKNSVLFFALAPPTLETSRIFHDCPALQTFMALHPIVQRSFVYNSSIIHFKRNLYRLSLEPPMRRLESI